MSHSQVIFKTAMLTAVGLALTHCRAVGQGPNENLGGSSSNLLATISGVENNSQAATAFSKGVFKLYCGSGEALATSSYKDQKLDFQLAGGAALSAGTMCYVNMELPEADRPAGKVSYYQGEGVYYATNQAPVVNTGTGNTVSLEIFKAYSTTENTGGESVRIKVYAGTYAAGANTPTPWSGMMTLGWCDGDKTNAQFNGNVVVTNGKSHVEATIENVPKAFLDTSCKLKFLAEKSRRSFSTQGLVLMSETIGSDSSPLILREVVEGKVSVEVSLKGECRKFDENRQCIFMFPESCAVPLGEAPGDYEHGKWLRCVSEAAGTTLQSLLRDTATIQQQQNRTGSQRLLQALQQIESDWGQRKTNPERLELMNLRLQQAANITGTNPGAFGIDDAGVTMGVDIMKKVMTTVKAAVETK